MAYNPEYVRNRTIIQQAERWQREGLLSTEQVAAIRQAYPMPFRDSNIFSEIGAFIFTGIAVGGAYALILLIIGDFTNYTAGFGLFNLFVSLGLIALCHSLINQYKLYRNGPDNALVVLAAAFMLTALNVVLPEQTLFWVRCLLAVPVLLAFVGYYGDVIITFITLLAFYAGIFSGFMEFSWGRLVLPFVLMGVSLLVRFGIKLLGRNLSTTYYTDALSLAEWVALLVLAAAGNYFVVRELNGLLMGSSARVGGSTESPQISLPWLFWLLTFLIPGVYTYLGFARKDRMFIILGLMGLAAATSTVRYYYPMLPLSAHLALVGTALSVGAVLTIRYLRQPRFGFTDVPDEESPRQFFLNAELLTSISATSSTINRPPDMRYGGGDFGGGGAGKAY